MSNTQNIFLRQGFGRQSAEVSTKADAKHKTKVFFRGEGAGFTLIELMLVVIIIGILVAMVMPRLAGRSQQARIAAAEADIQANIALALDLFELDMGRYPTTEEGLAALRQYSGQDKDKWKGPYLKKMPRDPWRKDYIYKFPGSHNNDYDLYSLGPNGIEGDEDDVKNWE